MQCNQLHYGQSRTLSNPTRIKRKAALERDITFIGTVNRIEVWAAENVSETEVEDIEELLESLDIDF